MKRVGISLGDALGIGPEVVALALADPRVRAALTPVVFGARDVLAAAAALRSVTLDAEVIEPSAPGDGGRRAGAARPGEVAAGTDGRELNVVHMPERDVNAVQVPERDVNGVQVPSAARRAGGAALACVDAAAMAGLRGEVAAICTAPLSKERCALAEPGFVGHTERLAQLCGAPTAMMMAGPRLRVVLATNHLALREVPARLRSEQIVFAGALAARALRDWFGIAAPRVAVLGLNPHAGDGGIFGDEEARIVAPAIASLRSLGVDASGPFPADGFFPRALRGAADVVLALYHDQGLIPVKLLDFKETVNVTLGLPFPRTSPDHGTADDIAGRGVADPEPMISALLLAARLAR